MRFTESNRHLESGSWLNDFREDVLTRNRGARNAHRRVHQEFLVFTQVGRWLGVPAERAGRCTWWPAGVPA